MVMEVADVAEVLKEIFGDTKRVSILEELVESWGEYLTISEISRMAHASEKTVYTHINELVRAGIVESKEGRATKYRLKKDDKRALALAILESEEYLRKIDISIKKAKNEELGHGVHAEPYFNFYRTADRDLNMIYKRPYKKTVKEVLVC